MTKPNVFDKYSKPKLTIEDTMTPPPKKVEVEEATLIKKRRGRSGKGSSFQKDCSKKSLHQQKQRRL